MRKISDYLFSESELGLRSYLVIFAIALGIRFLWSSISGIESFSGPDWARYDELSDNIINGNYNLDTGFFIVAPIYPYLVALIKFCFGNEYPFVLKFIQIIISSLSVIFLARTARLLFNSSLVEKYTALIFILYPMTLYWSHQFSQESLFQSLLIISLFFAVSYQKETNFRNLFLMSLLLSLSALIKSHIIIAFPLILLVIFFNSKLLHISIQHCLIFIGVFMVLTLPYGIYNFKVNNIYVLSSSGAGAHFLTGHNDEVYKYIVDPPKLGTKEHNKIKAMTFDSIAKLQNTDFKNVKEREMLFFNTGLHWITENPMKTIELGIQNLKNFFMPGVNKNHYSFKYWLISIIVSAPIFLLAYFEIIRHSYINFRKHSFIWVLIISMIIFSVVFYSQNRFRVITVEPWYIVYASSALVYLLRRFFIKSYEVRR